MAELRRSDDIHTNRISPQASGQKESKSNPGTGAVDANSFDSNVTSLPSARTKRHVLVVDDEEYVRGIVRSMLADIGLEAKEACDGDEALALFEESQHVFAACVIDLSMPGMAGLELLELIRERDANIPVVLVSGYARHEVRQREARSKNLSFLQKPFTLAQFKTAIDNHLTAA